MAGKVIALESKLKALKGKMAAEMLYKLEAARASAKTEIQALASEQIKHEQMRAKEEIAKFRAHAKAET